MPPTPIILDTDIGDDVDDVFALLLAARDPAYDLRAVTCVYGQVEVRARLARHVLDLAGKQGIPVAVGSSNSLSGPVAAGAPGNTMASNDPDLPQAGSVGWDDLGARLDPRFGPDLIVELVRHSTEPITLCAIGPLTNVALALRAAPDIAKRLGALVIMGGRLGAEAAVGEHNFNMDPEATAVVFASGAPIRLGTFEITRDAALGTADVDRLRAGDAACKSAAAQLERYLAHRNRVATSMYDPASLTLANDETWVRCEPMALRIETGPRLAVTRREANGPPNARASVAIDADGFASHLMTTILRQR
jgi:purine nucleosidase